MGWGRAQALVDPLANGGPLRQPRSIQAPGQAAKHEMERKAG